MNLTQRGRSGLQFLGSLQPYMSSRVRSLARATFEADPEGAALVQEQERGGSNQSWGERVAKAKAIAEKSLAFRMERFYQRYVAEENFARAIPAIEERREEAEKIGYGELEDCGGSLYLDETLPVPDYHDGVEWHLEPGGWDGYDLSGPMFMSAIHPYVMSKGGWAAVEVGENVRFHRANAAKLLPKKKYDRIFDMGCGGSWTLAAFHEVYPEAELVGGDLSAAMLKNGHDSARASGIPIHLRQCDVRHTGEPDNSFDAVVMYCLLHETPVNVGIDIIKEAFRILKPNGDIVINDVPPFAGVHPFQSVVLDWETANRGEPYFSETCATEWSEVLAEVGFTNIQSHNLGPQGYPWVDVATKPA